jgi:dihydroorotate dehydrogenase electron transfer subunit
MSQYQEKATVTRVEQFSEHNYRLTLACPQIAGGARPGQFVMVKAGSGKDPLLRRPFSIHQVLQEGLLQIYFKVVGRGTDILAHARPGDSLSVFGPLGQGYRLDAGAPAVFVGGGLGIAPLLFLVQESCRLKKDCRHDLLLLGGREKIELEPLLGDFKKFGLAIHTATDDGSLGHHGFITEVVQSLTLPAGCRVYSCGPEPMLAALGEICRSQGIACQVSVESVMACGMGACLGCSRPARNKTYTHVCLQGPVYDAEELVWQI